jgi:hypothetical protein
MLETFIKYILGEFRMIADAPVSFIVSVLGAALLIWTVLNWRYEGIITIIKTQRDDYHDKLGGASPDQAKARIDELEEQLNILRRQTEPRHLTSEERSSITQNARVPPGTRLGLTIVHEGGCPDCPHYAADFERVFRDAGWFVQNGVVMGPAQRLAKGIALMVPDATHLSADADLLRRALRAAHIEVEIMQSPQVPGGPSIQLFLTARPVP